MVSKKQRLPPLVIGENVLVVCPVMMQGSGSAKHGMIAAVTTWMKPLGFVRSGDHPHPSISVEEQHRGVLGKPTIAVGARAAVIQLIGVTAGMAPRLPETAGGQVIDLHVDCAIKVTDWMTAI